MSTPFPDLSFPANNTRWFAGALILFCIGYQYYNYLFLPPMYIHQWRQADGAMIARHYYEDGMQFFMPKRSNLYLTNDPHGVSEFPVLYYLAALLYKWFGFQHWYIRIISFTLFVVSLFSLRKLLFYITQQENLASLFTLLYFTSPVIVFYAANFMPDVPAVSLCFIGLERVVSGVLKQRKMTWIAGILLVGLGAMMKPPALIPYLAMVGTLYWLLVFRKDHFLTMTAKKQGYLLPAFLLLPLLMFAGWFWYVKGFNEFHQSAYFLTQVAPVWSMSFLQIYASAFKIFFLFSDYLNRPVMVLVLLMSLMSLTAFKSETRPAWIAFGLVIAMFLAYLVLFFEKFHEHDYYMLVVMPVIPIAPSFFYVLYKNKPWFDRKKITSFLAVLVAGCFAFTIYKHHMRTEGFVSPYTANNDFMGIEPALEKLGITRHQKVFVPGDRTSGVSLYFMHRNGYTNNSGYFEKVKGDSLLARVLPFTDAITLHPNYEPTVFFNQLVAANRIEKLSMYKRVIIYRVNKQ